MFEIGEYDIEEFFYIIFKDMINDELLGLEYEDIVYKEVGRRKWGLVLKKWSFFNSGVFVNSFCRF